MLNERFIRIFLLATLCFLVSGVSYGQSSQVISQGHDQQAAEGKQSAKSKKHVTEPKPILVKILPSPQSEADAKREEEERSERSRSEKLKQKTDDDLVKFTSQLASYTWLLVIVGVLQFCVLIAQIIFIWRQEKMARNIERAYVFAKVELLAPIVPTHEGAEITFARTLFVNHGKTPAIILNMTVAPYLTLEVPQRLLPAATDTRRFHEGWVIASENLFQLPIELPITEQEIGEIESGAKKLYCAGFIKYKDILEKERETGYCWEYMVDSRPRRFKFCYESRLNYYT